MQAEAGSRGCVSQSHSSAVEHRRNEVGAEVLLTIGREFTKSSSGYSRDRSSPVCDHSVYDRWIRVRWNIYVGKSEVAPSDIPPANDDFDVLMSGD